MGWPNHYHKKLGQNCFLIHSTLHIVKITIRCYFPFTFWCSAKAWALHAMVENLIQLHKEKKHFT